MLLKAALVSLIVWLLGVSGLYNAGTVVHVFLLGGLMLLLMAVAKARDGAGRPQSRSDER